MIGFPQISEKSRDRIYYKVRMEGDKEWRVSLVKGALWGAVLGDVIGAFLQFDKDVTPAKLKKAFEIPGGGKHHLERGQPTDDSQLNFAVIKGLLRGKGTCNLNLIAEQMGNWFLSKPIDVGNTIRNSVPKACNMKQHQAHLCRKGVWQRSQTSQSNGSLMALIGLAVWCSRLSAENIVKVIKEYTLLIHSNELVGLANSFYGLMIAYLMNHPGQQNRQKNAFAYAKEHLPQSNKGEFGEWIHLIESTFDDLALLTEKLPAYKASGWVRVALSYSAHFLASGKPFKECIEWIISQKGDTDTNACIMGGLLGASMGYEALHMEKQIEMIAGWKSKSKSRPDWLNPGLVLPKYIEFLTNSPTELNIIGATQEYPKK